VLFGLWTDGLPPAHWYLDSARHVESLGFDSLFLGDHVFFNVPNPETLTLLAAIATVTERIEIGTAVLLLALRQPAVVAKELATIEYLSDGRLVVGVGVGGEIAFEWAALGVPLARRGDRTDEYLSALDALWSGKPASMNGEFVRFADVTGSPAGPRPDGPPIWIGGRSDRALRRAANHDGWCAYALSPKAVADSIERLGAMGVGAEYRISAVVFACVDDDEGTARATADACLSGMYNQPFERFLDKFCAVGTPDQVAARIMEFRDAGVTDVLLAPQVPSAQYHDQIERLAACVAAGTR